MKKMYRILITLLLFISLNSCTIGTYPTTQDDIYVTTELDVINSNVDYNLVIRFGEPYYYNGNILYYLYNGLYYYPYYYDNYWYMRVYRNPFPYINHRPYFRPHRYDYRFNQGYRHPRNWYRYTPSNNHIVRPNTRYNYNNIRNRGNYQIPNMNRRSYQYQNTTRNNRINNIPNRNTNINRGGGSNMSRGRR